MSGLEIYGAIAATTSLIKVFRTLRDHSRKSSSAHILLDQALRSTKSQHDNLESSLKAIKTNLEKYDRDIKQILCKKDREAIAGIVDEIERIGRRCKAAITQLKAAVQKDSINRHELERLQDEFAAAVTAIQGQQQTFATQIAMESYRRLSESTSPPRPELRNPFDRSDSRTFASIDSGSERLHRHDTGMSTATTLSPTSTNGSGSGSIGSSTSLKYVKSERLQSIVKDSDTKTLDGLIASEGADAESIKSSALLYACHCKKLSIVRYLLSIDTSMRILDDTGLGVVHRTIGTSPQLSTSPKVLEILDLLANKNVSMSSTDNSPHRRTPLHYCVITGNYEAAKFILRRSPGAANKIDRERKTPLYHACEDPSPHTRLIELLLEKGANFATKRRPRIESREKKLKINDLLDRAESKRGPLTES